MGQIDRGTEAALSEEVTVDEVLVRLDRVSTHVVVFGEEGQQLRRRTIVRQLAWLQTGLLHTSRTVPRVHVDSRAPLRESQSVG